MAKHGMDKRYGNPVPQRQDFGARDEGMPTARIYVVGIGGAGNSAVNRMIQSKIRGVNFLALNTDAQALAKSAAPERLHIGKQTTRGLGAGMDPAVGKAAAEEDEASIREALSGADMVFITCGLGGGTGSGASPVVADIARELGALTVAVVTKPFAYEGNARRRIAEEALEELAERVDTVITIPNDRIYQMIDRRTPWMEAFRMIDDVLRQGVQGMSEVITMPGEINVDFADVKRIMSNSGSALMGIGIASGDDRAKEAAQQAISSPLLDISTDGARGILYTIAGSGDLSMMEIQEISDVITANADSEANIIFGTILDPSLGDEIKVTAIATGFNGTPFGKGKKRVVQVLSSQQPAAPERQEQPAVREERAVPEQRSAQQAAPQRVQADPDETRSEGASAEHAAPSWRQRVPEKNPDFIRRRPEESVTEEQRDEFDIPAFIRNKKNS